MTANYSLFGNQVSGKDSLYEIQPIPDNLSLSDAGLIVANEASAAEAFDPVGASSTTSISSSLSADGATFKNLFSGISFLSGRSWNPIEF